jgi:hypothetical protein
MPFTLLSSPCPVSGSETGPAAGTPAHRASLVLEAPETRAGRLIGGNMSKFLDDSKFFGTEYHRGKINVIMHLVSFSFLFYGLSIKSVAFVLTGLFVFDEMGHAYNYFFVHNRDPKFGLRMIPYQFLYGSLCMAVALKLFRWF